MASTLSTPRECSHTVALEMSSHEQALHVYTDNTRYIVSISGEMAVVAWQKGDPSFRIVRTTEGLAGKPSTKPEDFQTRKHHDRVKGE